MAELLAADAHDLGAKLAYRPWERRGRPFDFSGSGSVRDRKGFALGRTRSNAGATGITLQVNEIPVDQQIKSSSN